MKALFLYRSSWHLDKPHKHFLDSLKREFGGRFVPIGDTIPTSAHEIAAIANSDVCIMMLAFRDLNRLQAFDWNGYQGARVLYDHDAMNNYWTWGGKQNFGSRTSLFYRLRFDHFIVNDEPTAEQLRNDGISAEVVWKGFEGSCFHPLGFERNGLGTFGSPYPSRRATQTALKRKRIRFETFSCAYSELNSQLNRFEAILVTNSSGSARHGSTFLNWLRPGLGLRFAHGAPDVLGKSFEVAGSGAVLLTDPSPEFDEMGFVHGKTALIYEEIGDVVDVWRKWKDDPESLRRIGTAASQLVHERHTFDHRAQRLREVLEGFLR